MTENANLRAGDQDRDRTIETITTAFAEGRLTEDEYRQRLDAAHRAVTFGDLEGLTADLPAESSPAGAAPPATAPPAVAPVAPAPVAAAPERRRRRGLAAGWASWAGVSLLMIVIWLASSMTSSEGPTLKGFWPIWVIGPWGVAMVIASITSGDDD